jgi:hypothetical protein
MKGLIKIFVLILISVAFLLSNKVTSVFAQTCAEFCGPGGACDWGYHCDAYGICVNDWLNCPSCVGDTGEHGACRLIQDCPNGWGDGHGDCVSVPYSIFECCIAPTPTPTPLPYGTCKCDPNVPPPCVPAPYGENCRRFEAPYCLTDAFGQCTENCICVSTRATPTPTPIQPPTTPSPQPTPQLQCGDTCQQSNQCDQSQYLVCDPTYNLCESPSYCPICIGTISGNPGVCLDPNVCDHLGKNSKDGIGTCQNPGVVCCTNLTNFPYCRVKPYPPFYAGAYFWVDLNSSVSNMTYNISSSPASCSFTSTVVVDQNGYAQFSVSCSPAGHYIISATSINNTICGVAVDITSGPNPYLPCTGHFTKMPGECHYMECPLTTSWDGINPPYSDTGCPFGDTCCVYGSTGEIIPRPQLVVGCEKNGQLGINTALGCITLTSTTSLLVFILPWALGVGGGTAFILIIVGGFLYMTSGGDPRRAKAGKELLTSAIIGLLMIVFSVYILDLIGIRILNIPGI